MKKIVLFLLVLGMLSCTGRKNEHAPTSSPAGDPVRFPKGSFGFDRAFLEKYKKVTLLGDDSARAKVLIVNDFQARVMTSTARGDEGPGYGWINYDLIGSGVTRPHINPWGGEDRFWIGPEGGQYSVFFNAGTSFDFAHWQTPPLIDTEPFELVSATPRQATFRKAAAIVNYHGFRFTFDIGREIVLLNRDSIEKVFAIGLKNLRSVGYESRNSITNTGGSDWQKKNGLISIWILGMFRPSPETTIILPFEEGPRASASVTDDYFGVIPRDRKKISGDHLFLKGDGRHRDKVGIGPRVAKNIAGSYDASRHILTLIKFDVQKEFDYVNSKWEIQRKPWQGDVVNAYNDGPLADGSQLGPFYELESSSPAKELKRGETLTHGHITVHLEGDESLLNEVAQKTLGVSLAEIGQAFARP
jgi:hypothetical protein